LSIVVAVAPPPAPRTSREILVELLDTRLELGAAYVAHGQFAELQDLLEFAVQDARALVTIDDGAVQARIDAYAPKGDGKKRRKARRKKRVVKAARAPRSNAKEIRERPCPRPNCTWKKVTTANGLAIHVGRAHMGETF